VNGLCHDPSISWCGAYLAVAGQRSLKGTSLSTAKRSGLLTAQADSAPHRYEYALHEREITLHSRKSRVYKLLSLV